MYVRWLEQVGEEAEEDDGASVSTEEWFPSVQAATKDGEGSDDSAASDGFPGACEEHGSSGDCAGAGAGIPLERIGELESEIQEVFGSFSPFTTKGPSCDQEGKITGCSAAEQTAVGDQDGFAHASGSGRSDASGLRLESFSKLQTETREMDLCD
jgi:hypothetical protein